MTLRKTLQISCRCILTPPLAFLSLVLYVGVLVISPIVFMIGFSADGLTDGKDFAKNWFVDFPQFPIRVLWGCA